MTISASTRCKILDGELRDCRDQNIDAAHGLILEIAKLLHSELQTTTIKRNPRGQPQR